MPISVMRSVNSRISQMGYLGCKWPEEAPSFKVVACKDMRTNFHNPENVKAYIEKGYIRSAETLEELLIKLKFPKTISLRQLLVIMNWPSWARTWISASGQPV